MTATREAIDGREDDASSMQSVLQDQTLHLMKVLKDQNLTIEEARLALLLVEEFTDRVGCEPPEDEEVYIQYELLLASSSVACHVAVFRYWIDHYQNKRAPMKDEPECRVPERIDRRTGLDLAYCLKRKDVVRIVYGVFALRRETAHSLQLGDDQVKWLGRLPLLSPKPCRSMQMDAGPSVTPPTVEPVLKPILTEGSLTAAAFGGSTIEGVSRALDQYTRIIDLYIACEGIPGRLGNDGILPLKHQCFFEGESKLIPVEVVDFFNAVNDKTKWGLKGVEERELSDYLYDFTNGNGDVAFPVVEAFEKQHGYVSLDVSSLFRFWAGLTPYQKSSYRLRGLSRLQALDVITRIAERRIVERREAMELEEQAERNRLERSRLRYLNTLPTPLYELARPKGASLGVEADKAAFRLFQLLRKTGPHESAVGDALEEYKQALGPYHLHDYFQLLLKQARKLRLISTIDSPSGRLPLTRSADGDQERLVGLHRALEQYAALKRRVYTLVNHAVSRSRDLYQVSTDRFLEGLFVDLCHALGIERVCDLFGCPQLDPSMAVRASDVDVNVRQDGLVWVDLKRSMTIVEVKVVGAVFDVMTEDKIIGRSDAEGRARLLAYERSMILRPIKTVGDGFPWRSGGVKVLRVRKMAPPQLGQYCRDLLMKRIQSNRRWALSRQGLDFWAPLGQQSIGRYSFNNKIHMSSETSRAGQYDVMVAKRRGDRLTRRMRGMMFMLYDEVDNCRFIPAAGDHAPGRHSRGRSRTIDDFVSSLGTNFEKARLPCYLLVRRWGRLKRAKVLCERGYLLAAKMYLDKAFNVKEIVQHFACMYPGCMKPLLTSTTPCKCSGMFCDVHAHPLRHPCRDTELRLKGAMTLPEASSDEVRHEDFDDRIMLGLLMHVLNVARIINEKLKRRRWGRIPGTTGREDPPPGQFWRPVSRAEVHQLCTRCGNRPRPTGSSNPSMGLCSRCISIERNTASDRRLSCPRYGGEEAAVLEASKRLTHMKKAMAKAQKSSIERLSKPKFRLKTPPLFPIRQFRAKPVPWSSRRGSSRRPKSAIVSSGRKAIEDADGRGKMVENESIRGEVVPASDSGRLADVAHVYVEAVVMKAAASTVLQPAAGPEPLVVEESHLEQDGPHNELDRGGVSPASEAAIVEATLVEISDYSDVVVTVNKAAVVGLDLVPDSRPAPQLLDMSDVEAIPADGDRSPQVSSRSAVLEGDDKCDDDVGVYDPRKYSDEIEQSDWLVERTAPPVALEGSQRDPLGALFGNYSIRKESTEAEVTDLEQLFAAVDLNSL